MENALEILQEYFTYLKLLHIYIFNSRVEFIGPQQTSLQPTN